MVNEKPLRSTFAEGIAKAKGEGKHTGRQPIAKRRAGQIKALDA